MVGAQAPAAQPADLVLFNGRVITVDRDFTIASAVAISGERIVAVGDDAAVRAVPAEMRALSTFAAGGDPED